MQKYFFKRLLLISVLLVTARVTARLNFDVPMEKKGWTVFIYMAAANDLNPYAPLDLQEMMRVGSNENVNIVVDLTIHEDGKPKESKKLYVEQGKLTQIGATTVNDSGDVANFTASLEWAVRNFPSDHMAVIAWDHGSGPLNRKPDMLLSKGVCYDYDTGSYLTDYDLLNAFSWVRDNVRGGKPFDIIAFDACLLSSLEIAYTLSSCAQYLVASQETVPGDGYQYSTLLQPLRSTVLDPLSFSQWMVTSYNQEYAGSTSYTLSVIDLGILNGLVNNVNAVSQILSSQLSGKNRVTTKSIVKKCVSPIQCLSFDEGEYIDLCQFYKNLLKNSSSFRLSSTLMKQFQALLKTGINLFSSIVKANVKSRDRAQASGLSIYFSRSSIDKSYYNLYWTVNNSQWLKFLKAYVAF